MTGLLKFTIITAIPLHASIPTFWHHPLKNQRYRNWEHIVLEYGGTRSKAMWHSGLSPTHVSKPIDPLYSKTEALNKGLGLATGDVITFFPLNSSYRHADVLSKVAERMENHEVDLVYGDMECISKGNAKRLLKAGLPGLSGQEMLKGGMLPFDECFFVRRDWWQFFGGLDTNYQHSAGTARMLDFFTQPGLQVAYLDEALIRIAQPSNNNGSNLSRMLEEVTAFSKRKLLATYLTSRGLQQRSSWD